MARCDFCGAKIEIGTGKKFVRKDSKVFDFCSLKCEKNTLKLKRKPHTTPWTLSSARDKRAVKTSVERHEGESKTEKEPKAKKPAKKKE